MLVASAIAEKTPSRPPAAPSVWPVIDLVELTISPLFAALPKTFLIAALSAGSFIGVEVPWALI